MTSLRFLRFTFWNYYVLKLLHLETFTFKDATLSDINVVICYVLPQYHLDCCVVVVQNVKGQLIEIIYYLIVSRS